MKKLVSIALCAVIVASLTACGGSAPAPAAAPAAEAKEETKEEAPAEEAKEEAAPAEAAAEAPADLPDASGDPKVTFVFAEVNTPDTLITKVDQKFADTVNELSGGTINIDLQHSKVLGAEGEVLVDGKDIKTLRRREIASYISFLSQISRAYYSYSVYETVMQGRYVHGGSFFSGTASGDREVVERTLETLGLADLADKQITTLSGGQLQRVMLARCMAQESPVLILDEPMNHLDMKVQSEFIDYLLKWREKPVMMEGGREYAPTIIGVFHDINIAAYLADEIALISDGRLLAFGEKADILKDELLEKAYQFDVAGYLEKYRVR